MNQQTRWNGPLWPPRRQQFFLSVKLTRHIGQFKIDEITFDRLNRYQIIHFFGRDMDFWWISRADGAGAQPTALSTGPCAVNKILNNRMAAEALRVKSTEV